ncbi:programmed cell death protein 2-like isoform X1 [Schistocerca gregaria]|uniref:programmed cell death protein 2-like isoform X1 n=1 Tax=Schistocerca gregaria TaxID=7010 RepID=UPI00211E136D|nr:programmed cell death protein 2-like isoform X1 [Schistocerca gregaria]
MECKQTKTIRTRRIKKNLLSKKFISLLKPDDTMYLGFSGEHFQNDDEDSMYISKIGGQAHGIYRSTQENLDSSLKNKAEHGLCSQKGEKQIFTANESIFPQTPAHDLSRVCNCPIKKCISCGQDLTLVVQVHAPESLCPATSPSSVSAALGKNPGFLPHINHPQGADDDQLRTLLVFACNKQECCEKGKGIWAAYRYQPLCSDNPKNHQRPISVSNSLHFHTVQKTHSIANLFAAPNWNTSQNENLAHHEDDTSIPIDELTLDPPLQPISADTSFDLHKLESQQVPLNSKNAHTNNDSDKIENSDAETQDLLSVPKNMVSDNNSQAAKRNCEFLQLYLEFDREPSREEFEFKQKDILKKYDLTDYDKPGSWAGEVYESSFKKSDKPFHRFQKRLQRAPEQCLRYWRGYEPLWCCEKQIPKPIPCCKYCGSRRVFELQLVPGLIVALKPAHEDMAVNLNFGTVVIYTCERNCTSSTNSLFEEYVHIQMIDEQRHKK